MLYMSPADESQIAERRVFGAPRGRPDVDRPRLISQAAIRTTWEALTLVAKDPSLSVRDLTARFVKSGRYIPFEERRIVEQILNETLKWQVLLEWVSAKLDFPGFTAPNSISGSVLRRLYVYARIVFPAGDVIRADLIPPTRRSYHLVKPLEEVLTECGASSEDVRRLGETLENTDVARAISEQPDRLTRLALLYYHPYWLVSKVLSDFPDATERILETNNTHDPLVVRCHHIAADRLVGMLAKDHQGAHRARFHPRCVVLRRPYRRFASLRAFRYGRFQVQGEMPAFMVDILDPKPGEFILDMCAAPGGKTTYIAALMDGRGHLDAVDIDPERLGMVKASLDRLHISPTLVSVMCRDGRRFEGGPYDRILLDPSCTHLGILSRHSDSRLHVHEADVKRFQELQQELLENCARLLRPGGRLVYSTCTILREENEWQVERFLQRHSEFQIEDLSKRRNIPSELLCGPYYYPRKYSEATYGLIQSGFAASLAKVA